uniref:Uncharacterized protein n=1 Tax=Lotus japonicus TaxID=34305 RepID=I3T6T1_LOTJA|nr:unknown [Lotus japonicus]
MLEFFSLANALHALSPLICLLCTSCACTHSICAVLAIMKKNALSVPLNIGLF